MLVWSVFPNLEVVGHYEKHVFVSKVSLVTSAEKARQIKVILKGGRFNFSLDYAANTDLSELLQELRL